MPSKEQEYIINALVVCKKIKSVVPSLGNRADSAINEIIKVLTGDTPPPLNDK